MLDTPLFTRTRTRTRTPQSWIYILCFVSRRNAFAFIEKKKKSEFLITISRVT